MSRLGSTRKTIDESTQIEIEKYSEKFQISKNFSFWKHFFILYQIQISLQFFCFFFKKILRLFWGSDQMLNPHIFRILFLKYSSVTQIGIGSCTTLQALFLTAAPRMTLYSFIFHHTMLRIVIEYDFMSKLSLFLKSKFCCSNAKFCCSNAVLLLKLVSARVRPYKHYF